MKQLEVENQRLENEKYLKELREKELENSKKIQEELNRQKELEIQKMKKELEEEMRREKEKIKREHEEQIKRELELINKQKEIELNKIMEDKRKAEIEFQNRLKQEEEAKKNLKEKIKKIDVNKEIDIDTHRSNNNQNLKEKQKTSKDKNGSPIESEFSPNGNSEIVIKDYNNDEEKEKEKVKLNQHEKKFKNDVRNSNKNPDSTRNREKKEIIHNIEEVTIDSVRNKDKENIKEMKLESIQNDKHNENELENKEDNNDDIFNALEKKSKDQKKSVKIQNNTVTNNEKIEKNEKPKVNLQSERSNKADTNRDSTKNKDKKENPKNNEKPKEDDKDKKEISNDPAKKYLNKECHIKVINNEFEQHYHTLFDKSYSEKFPEKVYTFKRRREAILNNDYFNSYIMSEFNMIDLKGPVKIKYHKILEEQYLKNETELKKGSHLLFNNVVGIEESLSFANEIEKNTPNPYNSILSNVQDLKKILYNIYKIKKNETKVETWDYIRVSESDGDSFYRCFMFSLLEKYILSGNDKEIKKLIIDFIKIIQTRATLYEAIQLNIKNILKILLQILVYTESKSYKKAYNLLICAINTKTLQFDFFLVDYLRFLIHTITDDYTKQMMNEDKNIKIRNTKKPIQINEIEDVNLQLITNTKNEACKYSLQIAPMIFNVGLNVHNFDGYVDNNNSQIKEKTIQFKPLENSEFEINLLYCFNKYDLLYMSSEINQIKNEIENPFITHPNNQNCTRCKQNSFVSIPFYGLNFCLTCAKGYINHIIINNRVAYLNKENYFSREYYCRSIEIVKDFPLNDNIYCEIFKENICHSLLKKTKTLCFECDEQKPDELAVLPICLCNICQSCLDKKVKSSTKGYYILNKVEKNNLENKELCSCNEYFNYSKGATLLTKNISEYENAANQRFGEFCKTFCIKCGTLQKSKGKNTENNVENCLISITDSKKSETETEKFLGTHIVCIKCIKEIKIEVDKIGMNESYNHEIECSVCQVIHNLPNSELKNIFSKTDTNVCECSII